MKLCVRCSGTGKYFGNGMMMADCELCNGDELMQEQNTAKLKIDRKSKSYQTAIKDIMTSNPALTRKEAVKLFDEAYNNGG